VSEILELQTGGLVFSMDGEEFVLFRKKLKKTQHQMAHLLGTSLKTVQGYEQGWRKIPVHAERQMFFLATRLRETRNSRKSCWVVKKCPKERKEKCPAWEFQAGKLCWFVNGTICEGEIQHNWREKMRICRSCEVLNALM
jgi:hypothetical protein